MEVSYIFIIIIAVLGVCVGLAFIPANIAGKKGYSKGGFWAFGFFVFLPALIVSIAIPPHPKKVVETIKSAIPNVNNRPNANVKYCPSCGSACSKESSFCPKCGGRV